MGLAITPSGEVCGATVTGVDLAGPLATEAVTQIRAAWLEHHVLAFPEQTMTDDDLERFSVCFGPFGDDPFIAPIAGRDHVIAIRRRADETAPLFAENWHTDWSFQARPPAGTCLYGITIPPHGGDTLFADQHAAFDAMPQSLRARLAGRQAVHSARGGYARRCLDDGSAPGRINGHRGRLTLLCPGARHHAGVIGTRARGETGQQHDSP